MKRITSLFECFTLLAVVFTFRALTNPLPEPLLNRETMSRYDPFERIHFRSGVREQADTCNGCGVVAKKHAIIGVVDVGFSKEGNGFITLSAANASDVPVRFRVSTSLKGYCGTIAIKPTGSWTKLKTHVSRLDYVPHNSSHDNVIFEAVACDCDTVAILNWFRFNTGPLPDATDAIQGIQLHRNRPRRLSISRSASDHFVTFTRIKPADVIMRIVSTAGELRYSEQIPVTSTGTHTIRWNGRDNRGMNLGPGNYILTLHDLEDNQSYLSRGIIVITR